MEQVVQLSGIDTEQLAEAMVVLIKQNPKVRAAVMQCAYETPGVMVEY